MGSLECRAVGSLAAEAAEELGALLHGLSVCLPSAMEQVEVVLRPPAAAAAPASLPAGWQPDLRLQHDLTSPAGSQQDSDGSAGSRWTALQFSLHLRGKQNKELPAVVRHVTRAACTGESMPAFWQALGFAPRYALLRRGTRYALTLGGQELDVFLGRVLRLPPGAAAARLDGAALQAAEEVAPGRLLVEAVAQVPAEADHMESMGAITQLATLLAPHTTLQRPPRGPGEPL
ncbi:mediator of RNA polymerase II transcription subunit 18 isoform X1 [Micractinium conductrix]|uniref:Mediator of RNA polymerase II transcription subunit 18 isoform X1 n=1 Tax=Micractinium conductrix TaxID=554055 RepID=A0A2P6VHT5_9CHLO|nr:mediator of RNA polymerase II transcription subunit 18 isoform X1 [Micractinium conductrix]|eukprot:PSC73640.1 mediator of RNA polymerase II transcription subunit 18 isoform X1 [Micractinium conductrix]